MIASEVRHHKNRMRSDVLPYSTLCLTELTGSGDVLTGPAEPSVTLCKKSVQAAQSALDFVVGKSEQRHRVTLPCSSRSSSLLNTRSRSICICLVTFIRYSAIVRCRRRSHESVPYSQQDALRLTRERVAETRRRRRALF